MMRREILRFVYLRVLAVIVDNTVHASRQFIAPITSIRNSLQFQLYATVNENHSVWEKKTTQCLGPEMSGSCLNLSSFFCMNNTRSKPLSLRNKLLKCVGPEMSGSFLKLSSLSALAMSAPNHSIWAGNYTILKISGLFRILSNHTLKFRQHSTLIQMGTVKFTHQG